MKEYMEKDKYINCPICGKEKFKIEDGFIFCNQCGWEGNINTDENVVEINGYSINDYKKIFQEYLKKDPNYIWKKDKEGLNRYIETFFNYGCNCPVCGKETMEPDYRYCYNCGWKHNLVQSQFPDFENSSNKLSLNQYKKHYSDLIARNANYIWKNTDEIQIPFNKKQKEWLKNNNIGYFDKLTSDEELNKIYDEIEFQQKKYVNEDGYNEYMFIKSILDVILDNM